MDDWSRQAVAQWQKEMEDDPGIPLWEQGTTPDYDPALGQPEPSLVPFLIDREGASLVLVFPGGGFTLKAPHEGRAIARWLNQIGIAAAVLDYRLQPYRFPTIAQDASRAIRLARSNASEWKIDPGRIGVIGFSAGGTLVATTATHHDEGDTDDSDPVERYSSRPNAQILCYPFIPVSTDPMGQANNPESRAFMEDPQGKESARYYAADLNVTTDTPPAFLWGTRDDFLAQTWPPYLSALAEHQVPYEYHLIQSGPHGMGLAEDHESARHWPTLCASGLAGIGFRAA